MPPHSYRCMRASILAFASTLLVYGCANDPALGGAAENDDYPDDDPASYWGVGGATGALARPGDWQSDVIGADVRYDYGPAWEGGRNCTGTFTAGAAQLRMYLMRTYRIRSIGGYDCRQNTASPDETSIHGTGRALDVFIPQDRGQADNDIGDPIARWLIENAAELGVQYIIWDRTAYNSAGYGMYKYDPYTGPNPHTDHMHVELNTDGANRLTSFYGMPPPMPMPRPIAPTPGGGAPLLGSPLAESTPFAASVSHGRTGALVDYRCQAVTRASKGTVFRVPTGTPVYASAPGTVARINDNCTNRGSLASGCGSGLGNYVLIQHAGGRATLYGHLSPRSGLPRVGQAVGCGDLLGLSGGSGRTNGADLYFEVRDGVTGAANYFTRPPSDPNAGACSSQPESLWAGGAGPARTCSPAGPGAMPRGDDAAFLGATIPRRHSVAPGGQVRQKWWMRNTGSTTWMNPQYGLARTSGPAFEGPASIGLAAATTVAPGETGMFVFDATAPTEPGVHTARFRMTQGTPFGAVVSLELEVTAAPAGCRSATLGREVPSNGCVQVSFAGCGMASCGWYQCTDGAWTCAPRAGCDEAAAFANPACGAPGACGDLMACGMCAGSPGCVWCAETNACVDSAAACTTPVTTAAACAACLPLDHVCRLDTDCCGGGVPGGAIRCLAGYCSDTNICSGPRTICDTRAECCMGTACALDFFGTTQMACCLRAGDRCGPGGECCGAMECSPGLAVDRRCIARVRGESCASIVDCGGSLICEGGTCQ